MKCCRECGETKDDDDFYRKESSADRLSSHCKTCMIARASARNKRIKKENPELHRAIHARADKAWYEKHADRLRENGRKHYAKNRDAILAQQRAAYAKKKTASAETQPQNKEPKL